MSQVCQPCAECYTAELPACPESIYIVSESFEPGENIYLEIIDKFDNRYLVDNILSSYGGSVFFSTATLTEGLFNEYAGSFTFKFYTDVDCDEPKELIFCDQVYTCISVSFYKVVGAEREAVICCEPPAPY